MYGTINDNMIGDSLDELSRIDNSQQLQEAVFLVRQKAFLTNDLLRAFARS